MALKASKATPMHRPANQTLTPEAGDGLPVDKDETMYDSITYKVRVIMLDGPFKGEASDRKVVRSKYKRAPRVGDYLGTTEPLFGNPGRCRIDAVQRVPV